MADTSNITLDQVATNDYYDFYHQYYGDDMEPNNVETQLNHNSSKYYSTDEYKTNIGSKCDNDTLGCLNLNCQSIGGHWTALKQFISELDGGTCTFRFDVIGLTEIFRVPTNMTYHIDGYHPLEHKTRPENDDGRGGVGFFINSDIVYTVREDLSTFIPHVYESLFIEINIQSSKPIIIGIIYRPNSLPRANLDKFTESLEITTDKITLEHKKCIMMGDFNVDLLKYETHQKTRLLVDNMYSHGYLSHISRPTRVTSSTATILDHIYTNFVENNAKSGIIITDVADHYATFYIERKKLRSTQPKILHIRKHTPENIKIFSDLLRAHNFTNIGEIEDPDIAYDKFILDYTELYNIAFPLLTVKQTRRNTKKEAWMSTGLLNSSIHKSKLMMKKIRNPTEHHIQAYKTFNSIYNKTIRAAKQTYYKNILNNHKTDTKRTWKILNESIQKRSTKPNLSNKFLINGTDTENSQIIAHEFNKYFANIGKQVNNSVPHSDRQFTEFLTGNYPNNFFMNPVVAEEIKQLILKMKPKTSSGYDQIQMKIVSATVDHIKSPLAHIINQSFLKGVVPRQMKIAKIVPIFKSGQKNLFSNYRPISLLPAFSKILEKIVCNRLMLFLDKHDILYQHQYGFRKKHSTIHPIIHLLNYIAENNDKATKDPTLAIFLDLSKAFDTIPHINLLTKLQHYGIRGVPSAWFKSYLSERKQYMEINSTKSSEQTMECGVPQGSILGPILFILYINDLHKATKLNILSFADDTTVYTAGRDINEVIQTANTELGNLFQWFCANKMQLNAKKSKFAIFSPRQTRLPTRLNEIHINNQSITRIGNHCEEKSMKFLGVHLDENLTWQAHIDHINKKISQSLFAIYRVKNILPTSALKSLYYALIHSHLNYAIQIWGNSNYMYKIITRQKQAIRAISHKPYLSHTEPLFKQHRILKLVDLYNLQISLFMYDLHSNTLPPSFNTYKQKRRNYSIATRQTRTTYTTTDRARTDFSSKLPKHFFLKIWNQNNYTNMLTKSRNIAKKQMTVTFLNSYNNYVVCNNAHCKYCT